MMTPAQDPALADYLKALNRQLLGLPKPDRTELLREIEANVRERLARGETVAEILVALGDAPACARTYVETRERDGTLSWWTLQRVVFVRALRFMLTSRPALVAMALFGTSVGAIVIALDELAALTSDHFWFYILVPASIVGWYSNVVIVAAAFVSVPNMSRSRSRGASASGV